MRARWIGAIAALAAGFGGAAVVARGAPPATGSIVASDFQFDKSDIQVALNGAVTFSYPSGGSHHNVDFDGASGVSCGGASKTPATPAAPGWSGSCSFSQPGVYRYHCDLHPDMRGTVTVANADGSVPGTTTQTTPGTTTTTTPTSPPPGGGTTIPAYPYPMPAPTPTGTAPVAPAPAPAPRAKLTIRARQHGTAVRGTIKSAASRARITVSLRASGASVGKGTARASSAGSATFVVKLTVAARRTLARKRKLSVTVRITGAGAKALTSKVTLTPAS